VTPTAAIDSMAPRLHQVVRRVRETADTITLALAPQAGDPITFAPGQFNMLYAFGVGEVPISIASDPTAPGPIVHTIRSVGAVTDALCRLRPEGTVGVRGPFGTSWDVGTAEGGDVVFLAGGIGLAPLRPAVLEVLAHRERFGNVSVLVGARSPEVLLYRRQLAAWRSRFDVDVRVTVDLAAAGWQGPVGVVTTLLPHMTFDPSRTVAFVCGPEVMMRHAADALVAEGVAPSNVRLSLERNMHCGLARCGHCQLGPVLLCRDGPVVSYDAVEDLLGVPEL
jgi:NAD(P)H-flavin reductase